MTSRSRCLYRQLVGMAGRAYSCATQLDALRYVRVLCSVSFCDTMSDIPESRAYRGVLNARLLVCDIVMYSDCMCKPYSVRYTSGAS